MGGNICETWFREIILFQDRFLVPEQQVLLTPGIPKLPCASGQVHSLLPMMERT